MSSLRWAAAFAMLWLALLVALCSSCTPLRVADLPDDERRAVDATIAGWRAAGLPSLEGCLIEYARVVHTQTDAEFLRRCTVPASYAAACLTQESVQVGLRVHGVPVAVLRPGQPVLDSSGSVITHELLHAAYACTIAGHGDVLHADPRVWLAAGGETSAQGMARELLRR